MGITVYKNITKFPNETLPSLILFLILVLLLLFDLIITYISIIFSLF